MSEKILIIGKYGQLASALLIRASDFGFNDVVAYARNEMDILDPSSLEKCISSLKPDVVINTAAFQVMLQCETEPYKAMQINFIAVKNLAEICKKNNALLVTLSSDYVFSGSQDKLNGEIDSPEPLQIYGLSKLAGEYAALSVYPEGVYVIRTCGLYGGLKGSPNKGNFVLNMIREASEKDLIEVSSDQVVSPTYSLDLSDAIYKMLRLRADPGIYHLVNDGYCSWYEFTKEIFKLAKIKKELRGVDRNGYSGNANRPRFSALKNCKAASLGISLPNWQSGLNKYIDFLKENNLIH